MRTFAGGREYLKKYRCIQGVGGLKFRVFIAYVPDDSRVQIHELRV